MNDTVQQQYRAALDASSLNVLRLQREVRLLNRALARAHRRNRRLRDQLVLASPTYRSLKQLARMQSLTIDLIRQELGVGKGDSLLDTIRHLRAHAHQGEPL